MDEALRGEISSELTGLNKGEAAKKKTADYHWNSIRIISHYYNNSIDNYSNS